MYLAPAPAMVSGLSKRKRGFGHKRNVIPKNLSRRDKNNLKRALVTLGEKKYYPVANAGTAVGSSGLYVDLVAMAQGDSDTTRDGDQLTIRSLECNWSWSMESGGDFTNIGRLIIFQWFSTEDPTAAVTNVLLNAVTSVELSPYNHDLRYEFRILLDITDAMSIVGPGCFHHRKYITKGFKDRKVQFTAGTTVGTNKLYALAISDSSVAIHPTFSYSFKLNYADN